MSFRVGIGFDAHRLVAGQRLILGGVTIDYPRGLEGHSDGDALLHAVTDALLGAVAAPDIGSLFPSGDVRYQGAASRLFVEKALAIVSERGHRVFHLDVVVIAQEPQLSPYFPAIRENLVTLLGLSQGSVGLKATTTDGMGFTGRGEGIAVQAIATVGPARDRT